MDRPQPYDDGMTEGTKMHTKAHFMRGFANHSKSIIRRMSIFSYFKEYIPENVRWFLDDQYGYEYGITRKQKIDLIQRFQDNVRNIECASAWEEHLEMASYLLRLSPSMEGAAVECGCYKGASTVNLSLACSLVNRKLIVCDSFKGLPQPEQDDIFHETPYTRYKVRYKKGMYSTSIDEVRENLRKFGYIHICQFVEGYFEEMLPRLDIPPLVMVFLDVDLKSSLKTCLQYLWPRLVPGSRLYSHEAQDLDFVSLFFDKEWWSSMFGQPAPGFIGAGTGLPLRGYIGSGIGYTIKR
jgi:O-methyltransferase